MKFFEPIKQNIIVRIALYIAIIALVVSGYSFFTIKETVSEIKQRRAVLDSRQNLQLNFEEVLDLYARQYDKVNTNITELLLKKENLITYLDTLEAKSKELDITIKIQNIPVAEGASIAPFVRYRISFESDNTTLLKFIQMLKDTFPFIEIQDISTRKIPNYDFLLLAGQDVTVDIFIK